MANSVFINSSNRSIEDRFIPTRCNFNVELAHYKLISNEDTDIKSNNDIFSPKPKRVDEYRKLLQSALNVNDLPIYSFQNKTNVQKKKEKKTSNKMYNQWPCMPRKFSVLTKPDIILDWPYIHPTIHWNIVDWGSNGYMATIWSRQVYLWRNRDGFKEEVTHSNIQAYGALKWNRAGTQLAVGNIGGSLSVWAFPEKKELYSAFCYLQEYETCCISVLAWDLTDSILVSGCSKGLLFMWGEGVTSLGYVNAHSGRIISLAFNCTNKYLCSSGADGMVRVWMWPTLEAHVEVTFCSPVRVRVMGGCPTNKHAIAFHPWRSSLLAAGGGLGDGSLSLWNVATATQVAYHEPASASLVDCATWSPVTGELVTSHRLTRDAPRHGDLQNPDSRTKVLVLAGLDRVVECVDGYQGRVLYLMWDRTGTQLATACSDESLCIWNFFGTKSKNYEGSLNRSKILGQYKVSVLSKLEKCIR